jgi:hypothetical protein
MPTTHPAADATARLVLVADIVPVVVALLPEALKSAAETKGNNCNGVVNAAFPGVNGPWDIGILSVGFKNGVGPAAEIVLSTMTLIPRYVYAIIP